MCRVTMGEKLVATPSYGSLLHFDLEVRLQRVVSTILARIPGGIS